MNIPESDANDHKELLNDPIRWKILIILLCGLSLTLISVSIINVALPAIQEGLNASRSALQWVLSGYALSFGVVLIGAGRAGDIIGRGGLYIVGIALFALSSIGAGLAPDSTLLNTARFLQGVGSGLLSPQALGMIQQYFKGEERGRAFGFFGSAVGVSVAIGPVIGGFLIELAGPEIGWRLTFLVNVPICVIALILCFKWFPRPLFSLAEAEGDNNAMRLFNTFRALDPIGSTLIGLAVLAVLFPFMESRSSTLTWLLFPLGILLTYLWVKWERYYASIGRIPMVDLGIFATRSFSNGTIIMSVYFLGMTSIWIIVALYMQQGLGMTALEASVIGIPAAITSSFAADWAGKRVMQYGRHIVIIGLITGITGVLLCILVVQLQAAGYISIWWWLASLFFVGIAQGSVISPNQTLTLVEVPLAYAGSSAAVMQTGQRIGTSVGIAIITAALFGTLAISNWRTAVSVSFALIAIIMALALFVAIQDLKYRKKKMMK